jgi:hypothetical protein
MARGGCCAALCLCAKSSAWSCAMLRLESFIVGLLLMATVMVLIVAAL